MKTITTLAFLALALFLRAEDVSMTVTLDSPTVSNPEPAEVWSRGDTRFIEGKEGVGYTVTLQNKTGGRVLAIMTVDGRDVIKGEPSRDGSSGYVLAAGETLEVKGWRTSLDEVRRFSFSERGESYAAKLGDTSRCGVIALRAYSEEVLDFNRYLYLSPINMGDDNMRIIFNNAVAAVDTGSPSAIKTANVNLTSSDLGTAFGKPEESKAQIAHFKRGKLIQESTLYYMSSDALAKFGINVKAPPLNRMALPNPWSEFCQPPPES